MCMWHGSQVVCRCRVFFLPCLALAVVWMQIPRRPPVDPPTPSVFCLTPTMMPAAPPPVLATQKMSSCRLKTQYHTPLAVGTLLGLTTMMSQFMFVLFAVFLALAEYADTGSLARGDRTMAVFSFFLFLLYVSRAVAAVAVCCCWCCRWWWWWWCCCRCRCWK